MTAQPPDELLKELGAGPGAEPIDSGEWKPATKVGYVAMIAVLVGFGLLMAGLGFGIPAENDQEKWLWPVFGLGACALFVGTCLLWWVPFYRNIANAISLYPEGMVWNTSAKGWRARKWADATTFWRYEVVNKSGPAGSLSRVVFTDGTELRFGPQLDRYPVLAEQAQRFVHRQLVGDYRRRFDAGEALEFGPVTIDRTRVAIKASSGGRAEEFALADLGIVSLGFGVVAFLKDANTRLGSEALSAIPNYTVLLALLPVKPAGLDPDLFE